MAGPGLMRRVCATVAALTMGCGAAVAHGPDMAVTAILTGDADAPELVRLTRGLAVAAGGNLQFICPERWGGPDAPGVAVADGAVVVAGLRGPVRVERDGRVTTLSNAAELQGGRVRAVASDGVRVLALTTAGAIWELAPGTPRMLAQLGDRPDTLAAMGPGAWVLASENDGELALTRLRTSGDAVEVAAPFLVAPFRANPALVVTPAGEGEPVVWVVGAASDGQRLWRVDGDRLTALAATAEPIFGPVAADGEVVVVLGGQPHRVRANDVEPLAETARLFCLHALADGGLTACVGVDLYRYAPEDGIGEVLLQVAMLREPALDGLPPGGELGCRAEWQDAATDAGLAAEAGPEVVAEPAPVSPGDGCGAGRGAAGLLAVWSWALRRWLRALRPAR